MDVSRGWLVQVVYAMGLHLVDRLYMRHNCVVVADSSLLGVCNGSFGTIRLAGLYGWAGLGGALAPARLAFGRLSAIIETPRLAGLQGWDRSGGWLEQVVYATQLHQAARCICDTIAWWWQTL